VSDALVPPDAAALIGTVTSGPTTVVVTAREAQRYAQAVDDLNPVYFDEAAAVAAGHRTLVAPPTFLDHAVVRGRAVADLRTDGMFADRDGPALPMKRVMFGGQEWEWFAPVHVGDTITAVQRLRAIEEKQGSKGPFAVVTWETTFTNQAGDEVARARLQGISR
jgi:acyl dehydratase